MTLPLPSPHGDCHDCPAPGYHHGHLCWVLEDLTNTGRHRGDRGQQAEPEPFTPGRPGPVEEAAKVGVEAHGELVFAQTPEQAWEEFALSLPAPIAPACRCADCGARVPERDHRYHAEELAQLRDEFLRLFRGAQQRQTP